MCLLLGLALSTALARCSSVSLSIAARILVPLKFKFSRALSLGCDPNQVLCHHRFDAGTYQLRYPSFNTCRGAVSAPV